MAILQKYAPEQEQAPAPKKGLLGKFFSRSKTPAQAMYDKITGTFKDLGDEPKVAKMLQEFAPNMTAEDKAAVVNLAKEVQNIKADKDIQEKYSVRNRNRDKAIKIKLIEKRKKLEDGL